MTGRGQTPAPASVFAPRRGGALLGPSGLSRGTNIVGATTAPSGVAVATSAMATPAAPAPAMAFRTQQPSQQNIQAQSRSQQHQPPLQQQQQQFGNLGKRTMGTTGQMTGGFALPQQQQQQPVTQEAEEEEMGLSDIQVREITKVFGIFDLDKNGLIDQSEFLLACQAIDIPVSKGEATELMQHWGVEKPRTTITNLQLRPKYFLNEDSFFSIVGPRVASRDPGEDAARAFAYIDVEGKGFINHADLRRVAERVSTIDQTIEDAEIAAMLEAADVDGDGIITSEEFFDIAFD